MDGGVEEAEVVGAERSNVRRSKEAMDWREYLVVVYLGRVVSGN